MIKLEHVVLASPEQMKFIIEGMRNPMNSWEKSDSRTCRQDGAFCMECEHKNDYCLANMKPLDTILLGLILAKTIIHSCSV